MICGWVTRTNKGWPLSFEQVNVTVFPLTNSIKLQDFIVFGTRVELKMSVPLGEVAPLSTHPAVKTTYTFEKNR